MINQAYFASLFCCFNFFFIVSNRCFSFPLTKIHMQLFNENGNWEKPCTAGLHSTEVNKKQQTNKQTKTKTKTGKVQIIMSNPDIFGTWNIIRMRHKVNTLYIPAKSYVIRELVKYLQLHTHTSTVTSA